MKLIEKMSRDIANGPAPDKATFDLMRTCYVAGFLAAREMAAEIEWNASANSEEFHKIKEMGEQEVE